MDGHVNTAARVALAIAMIIATGAAIKYGAERVEQAECRTWQSMAEAMPDFYLTDWQKEQCGHYGIEVSERRPEASADQTPEPEKTTGIASWYDYDLGFEDQKCTKDREPCYSQRSDTCASRDYPRGTILIVTYYAGDDDWEYADGTEAPGIPTYISIKCRVNDYGPEEWTGAIIDLSSHAFQQLVPLEWGLITVHVEEAE